MLALIACIARVPPVDDQFIEVARARRTAVTSEELARERDTFVDKCSGCHTAPAPRRHEATEWPAILDDMRSDHDVELDEATRARILAYVESAIEWDAIVRVERQTR